MNEQEASLRGNKTAQLRVWRARLFDEFSAVALEDTQQPAWAEVE